MILLKFWVENFYMLLQGHQFQLRFLGQHYILWSIFLCKKFQAQNFMVFQNFSLIQLNNSFYCPFFVLCPLLCPCHICTTTDNIARHQEHSNSKKQQAKRKWEKKEKTAILTEIFKGCRAVIIRGMATLKNIKTLALYEW